MYKSRNCLLTAICRLYFFVQYPIKLGMRNKTIVPAATFKALFQELIPCPSSTPCCVVVACVAAVLPWSARGELICGLVFHVVAEAGTLAQHVKQLTGKRITDGALAQRRALLPLAVFEQLMGAALQPKADPARHPDAFYQGLRLCGVDGSLFSVTNTPQVKKQMRKARSRRGRAAFPKVGVAVLVELGLHNPLAAALGAKGESEMVLAKQVLSAQPEKSLVINDRYYGMPDLLVGLPARGGAAFLGAGEKQSEAALAGGLSRWQRVGGDWLGQDNASGARDSGPSAAGRAWGRSPRCACGPVCWTGVATRRRSCWRCMAGAGSRRCFTRS